MKKFSFALLTMLLLSNPALASDKILEEYVTNYDYDSRL